MTSNICFVGLENLPALTPEFEQHRIGGAQVQQSLLAKTLARRGLSVSMVVGDYGQPDGAIWSGVRTYKAYRADEGIPVVRFVYPRWSKLCGALARADADIYYVSCAGAEVGQVALWTARNDRRMIFRVASDADCDPHHVLITFWRDRKLYEYGLRRAAAVLAQSAKQQALMRKNYGVDCAVASSLVDLPGAQLSFMDRDISLLWVSNIQQLKRPEKFLALARRVPDCTASMVGGPLRHSRELFQEISRQAQSIANLTFCGSLPYGATNKLFDRARVFVNTSEIEGFPNTFLQAWVRGVPVVSFFDPDGVIRREGLGYAVSNAEEMAGAVQGLSADSRVWSETSERCRRYMTRYCGEDEILAPYLAAIDRIAVGRAGKTVATGREAG